MIKKNWMYILFLISVIDITILKNDVFTHYHLHMSGHREILNTNIVLNVIHFNNKLCGTNHN